MAEYNRDRYLPETPAEERERLKSLRLRWEAENLAAQMIEQQLVECPETGVTCDQVLGNLDDHDFFGECVFGAAAGNPGSARLMKNILMMTATRVIEAELKKRPSEAEQRAIDWCEQREQLKRGIA